MSEFRVPLFLRGEVIEEDWKTFGGRRGSGTFEAPDTAQYIDRLPLSSPLAMADLYEISFEEILDVLEELGRALDFEKNKHLQQAYAAGLVAANYPPALLANSYTTLPYAFDRESIREIAETRIGIDYLEGWVPRTLRDGREVRIRAFGSRALHVPAGNGGLVSAVTIIRNAITRSDAIIKVPSNDPLTALAIARTLAEVAPNHPLTKHLAVAYWKGGDLEVEQPLYRPENIEKIVAWGGFASVKHVTRYIQPGLEMIGLDPKRSATIIGPEAFQSEETLDEVALRAACDIGVANQEACASARVIYVLCGSDAQGIERANRLGQRIYEKLVALPEHISSKPKSFDRELRDHIEASRMTEDWFRVIGGEDGEGAVIVSQMDEPVDYSPMLSGRVANLVPVDDIKKVTEAVNAYTQTVGIFPESLKRELRDQLPLFGAQRLTSLGYACHVTTAMPQDAIEPVRRMCKWIVDEECDPEKVFPMWKAPALA
ncbi:MAG: long-chain-fatty-acyl-CoA reductase [Deltaproteobacteria bacterium]|nr:long-chain-fatty-acyl-CoA reductase [Deltaproteobacteria bacterium]MBW2362477.1 long-chain-fatty-acyl-CoA reductase [Deltaproteobacteria bacterium]